MIRTTVFAAILTLSAGAALAGDFTVTSPDFADGTVKSAQIANAFGCSGDNKSPALIWSGVPEGTQSFAVSMYDKDAPTGSGFWHWVVVDIPASVTTLEAGAGASDDTLPAGSHMTKNDAGSRSFLGACPPPGDTHDYTVTVKALKVKKLELPEDPSAALVGFVSNMNTLASATITAKGSH